MTNTQEKIIFDFGFSILDFGLMQNKVTADRWQLIKKENHHEI